MIVQVWISDIKIFPRWRSLKRLHFLACRILMLRRRVCFSSSWCKNDVCWCVSQGGMLFYDGLCYSDQKPKQNVSLYRVKLSNVHFFKSVLFLCRVVEALVSRRMTRSVQSCAICSVFCPKIKQLRLQLVPNTAARLLAGTRKKQHVTPVLASLHWLPLQYRIDLKLLIFVYKMLYCYIVHCLSNQQIRWS